MKKVFVLILSVLMLSASVFATAGESDNYQKIYSVSDPVFGYIRDLYIIEGYALPSTTGPWSGGELALMLSVFEDKNLEGTSKNLYEAASQILDSDAAKPSFKAGLEVDEELYLNTSSSSPFFLDRDNWVRGWANEKPFLNFITE